MNQIMRSQHLALSLFCFLFLSTMSAQVEVFPDSTYFNEKVTIDNAFENNGMRYPLNDGFSGQVLTTNGKGLLQWKNGGTDFRAYYSVVCDQPVTYDLGAANVINDECGTLYDSGGPAGNYANNENNGAIISFAGNPNYLYTRIILRSLEIDDNRDTLFIEGMAFYVDLTEPDTLFLDGSLPITIAFKSDNLNNEAGFELTWDRVAFDGGESVNNMTGFFFNAEEQSVGGGVSLNNNWKRIGKQSVLFGFGGKASSDYTTSIGYKNESSGFTATTFGYLNIASSQFSQASGYQSQATGAQSQAFGYLNMALGANATAIGQQNTADTTGSISIGFRNKAQGYAAGSIGFDNEATENRSNAFGAFNNAKGERASAFGYLNSATADNASAFGYSNNATMPSSSAFGAFNEARGERSLAMGYLNDANGEYGISVGYENKSVWDSVSMFGFKNQVSRGNATALGYKNTISGLMGVALGALNDVGETSGLAVGISNDVSLANASAFGQSNVVVGSESSAFGYNNQVSRSTASAFGYNNSAGGNSSSAFGAQNEASGTNSSAFGYNTLSDVYQMMAVGSFNEDPVGNAFFWNLGDPIFMIGNGQNEGNRSTALTVLKNGKIGIGTTGPTYDLDVTGELRTTGDLTVQGRLSIGSGEEIFDAGTSRLMTNSDWLPVGDDVFDLGSSTNRWSGVWAADGTINTSDRRLKTNIEALEYGLEQIMSLKPVTFKWKGKEALGNKLGLIAQDLLEVIPEVVKTHSWERSEEDDLWSAKVKVPVESFGVYYADIIPVLIKGIQEQQVLLEDKEQRILELELKLKQLEILEQRIEKLEVEK